MAVRPIRLYRGSARGREPAYWCCWWAVPWGPVTVSAEWEGLGAAYISPVLAQPSSSFHSFSRVINLRGQLGLSSDICKGQLKGLWGDPGSECHLSAGSLQVTGTQPLLAFTLPQEPKLPLPSSLSSISFHPGLLLHLSTGLLKPGSPGNQGKSDRECGSQQKLGSPCTLPFLALPQPISSLPTRQALPGDLYKCRVLGSYREHGVNCAGWGWCIAF